MREKWQICHCDVEKKGRGTIYLLVVVMSLGELFGLLVESGKGAEGPGLPLQVPSLHHHTQILQESKCNKYSDTAGEQVKQNNIIFVQFQLFTYSLVSGAVGVSFPGLDQG